MRPPAELLFEAIGRGVSALAAAADPDLPDLLAESEGRRLALVVRGADRMLEIEVRDGALRVLPPHRTEAEGAPLEADLRLAGSVPDFLRFLRAARREPPPDDPFGPLEVHGSPEAKAGFAELLCRIDPDYEALLARAVGGVAARAAARTTLGRLYGARRTAARLVDDVTEYLEEETHLVPDPAARTRFSNDVRALIGKVAELEERLDRAAARRG